MRSYLTTFDQGLLSVLKLRAKSETISSLQNHSQKRSVLIVTSIMNDVGAFIWEEWRILISIS